MLNTENEKYARMDLEDATDAETLNKTELKQLEFRLQDLKAEAAWETTEIPRFQAILDGDASEADKDAAKQNLKGATDKLNKLNEDIASAEGRKTELTADSTAIKTRQDAAAAFLAEAEERRAQQEMEEQAAIFEAFQADYNLLKEEYDGLVAKDDDGSITTSERSRMGELEEQYLADQARYDALEEERVSRERENMEKQYNNAKMALDRATASATIAKA